MLRGKLRLLSSWKRRKTLNRSMPPTRTHECMVYATEKKCIGVARRWTQTYCVLANISHTVYRCRTVSMIFAKSSKHFNSNNKLYCAQLRFCSMWSHNTSCLYRKWNCWEWRWLCLLLETLRTAISNTSLSNINFDNRYEYMCQAWTFVLSFFTPRRYLCIQANWYMKGNFVFTS
jgi:hypothetical protein